MDFLHLFQDVLKIEQTALITEPSYIHVLREPDIRAAHLTALSPDLDLAVRKIAQTRSDVAHELPIEAAPPRLVARGKFWWELPLRFS